MTPPSRIAAYDGVYRRRIKITTTTGYATADLEDDPHRFGVDIDHDGARVVAIHGRALRTPWNGCALAANILLELIGTPLLPSPFTVLRQVNLASHCTHMLDLAGLAIAAAARGIASRNFDVTLAVENNNGEDRRMGTISRDGARLAAWSLCNGKIIEPVAYAGRTGLRVQGWAAAEISDLDEAESIFVMQRALQVSGGMHQAPDFWASAGELTKMRGACFTFQPARSAAAARNLGSTKNFTQYPDLLLADLPLDRNECGTRDSV